LFLIRKQKTRSLRAIESGSFYVQRRIFNGRIFLARGSRGNTSDFYGYWSHKLSGRRGLQEKQRNRETKLVLSIVERATVFVWPREHTCIPLPINIPRASSGDGISSSIIMTKPTWEDHHLVLNIKV
jgi:hypothetical protein